MDKETEQYWLVLQAIAVGNSRTLLKLRNISENPLDILQASARAWLQQGVKRATVSRRRGWQRELLAAARQQQCKLRSLEAITLSMDCPAYPPLLKEIPDPPALLFARGNTALLQYPYLAVVGSRKASAAGRRATAELCTALVESGLGICSGLALGIDGAAHSAALDAKGATVAVVATGLDQCYPRRHRPLADRILEHGVLITEFPLGSRPLRERFPQRNRIISGLSLGVLVIEAASRSGSLITARMALEQNREVFALPHSIYHAQGQGCNALLKEGAQLVDSPDDIVPELAAMAGCLDANALPTQESPTLESGQRALLELIGGDSMSLDELVTHGNTPAATTMSLVTEMQLLGLLENRDGRYSRC